jgi:uncharacterized BrkB/YihY/UPF0761 family membrane protein
MTDLFALGLLLLFFYFIYQLFALVGDMTDRRGSNPWTWWLIALFWSPITSIVILWIFYDIVEDDEVD